MRLALALLAVVGLGAAETAPPAADPAGGAAATPAAAADGPSVPAKPGAPASDEAPAAKPEAPASDEAPAPPAAASGEAEADDEGVDPKRVPGAFGVGGSLDRLQRQNDARNQQLQDLAED